jgi:hypothetical protein
MGQESSPGLAAHTRPSPWLGVSALAFGHGANDMYMGFLPALLPLIATNLDLDYKRAGALVSIVTLTSRSPSSGSWATASGGGPSPSSRRS